MSRSLLFICLLFVGDVVFAETIFYLHGRIVEDEGPRPVHERFGLYDYPAIVDALGADGALVVSDQRESGTKAHEYARTVVEKIEEMIASGTAPEDITVVGFSKGGSIAIMTSYFLGRPDVNFVFIAACADWISSAPQLVVSGNILSIVEESDALAGSCANLASRNENLSSFTEVVTSTGKEHGAFYLPEKVWVEPLLAWIAGGDDD
jgi:hypothetical protein